MNLTEIYYLVLGIIFLFFGFVGKHLSTIIIIGAIIYLFSAISEILRRIRDIHNRLDNYYWRPIANDYDDNLEE